MSSIELLTVREVADALGITRRAVQYRIERGALVATRMGTQLFVTRGELERVLSAAPAAS